MIFDSNIDWSATGSMIGGIGSWFAFIGTIVIAVLQKKLSREISTTQFNQTDLQLKMSIFDKRYQIFSTFEKCYELSKGIQLEEKDKRKGEVVTVVNLQRALYNNISKKSTRNSDWEKAYVLWQQYIFDDDLTQEKKQNILNEYNNLQHKFYEEDRFNAIEYEQLLKMTRFCFPIEIADVVERFSKQIFDWYIYSTSYHCPKEYQEKYMQDLKLLQTEIEEKKIIDKMSEKLNLNEKQ